MKHTNRLCALLTSLFFVICSFTVHAQVATVKIGKQTWAASNLDVTAFSDGTPINEAKNIVEWTQYAESGQPAWCYYKFDAANGKQYGKLYNIHVVLSAKGIAPAGFHVPDNDDWKVLESFLGGSGKAAELMKSTKGWMNNANGKNTSEFNALPGGYLNEDNTFSGMTYVAAWWSANEYAANINEANKTGLYNFSLFAVNSSNKHYGFALRLVKN